MRTIESSPTRLSQLDGLRGLSACVIAFVFHTKVFFHYTNNPMYAIPILDWFVEWGWVFVDLFFVLSGFVFSLTYLTDGKMRDNTTAGRFIFARVARLWPLHLAMLLLVIDWTNLLPNLREIALSAFGLHVFLDNPTTKLNGPAWSLSVELICYILFLIGAKLGQRPLLLLAGAGIFIGIVDLAVNGTWGALIGRGLIGFFAGVLLFEHRRAFERVPSFLLMALATIPFFIVPDGIDLLLATMLAWPALILLVLRGQHFAHPWLVWLGDRSYAIYLCHIPLYYLGLGLSIRLGLSDQATLVFIAVVLWPAILAFSHLLYEGLERPAQRLMLKWFEKRQRASSIKDTG